MIIEKKQSPTFVASLHGFVSKRFQNLIQDVNYFSKEIGNNRAKCG